MKAVGKNGFLDRKVVVQRPFRHIGGGSDLLHGDLGVPIGSEEIEGDLDQTVGGLLAFASTAAIGEV